MNIEEQNLEESLVFIIANAGDSKSNSLVAIEAARNGDFDKARKLLSLSEESLEKAHNLHTELLSLEAKAKLNVTLLMVHDSNHLSIADISQTLASEIVYLHEKDKIKE